MSDFKEDYIPRGLPMRTISAMHRECERERLSKCWSLLRKVLLINFVKEVVVWPQFLCLFVSRVSGQLFVTFHVILADRTATQNDRLLA